jgi:hypothetical protein
MILSQTTNRILLCFCLFFLLITGFTKPSKCNKHETISEGKSQELFGQLCKYLGLELNNSSLILFHQIDTERYLGYEQWLLFSDTSYNLNKIIPVENILKLYTYNSTMKVLNVRLAPGKIKGEPKQAIRLKWTYKGKIFRINQLNTTAGEYLLFTSLPYGSRTDVNLE